MSQQLMLECRNVCADALKQITPAVWQQGEQPALQPQNVLQEGYDRVQRNGNVEAGSTTAVILEYIHHAGDDDVKLLGANLGDSGFLCIRRSQTAQGAPALSMIGRSAIQTIGEAPYQLAVIPRKLQGRGNIDSKPKEADVYAFALRDGDIVVSASDGLWDNIPKNMSLVAKSSWTNLPATGPRLPRADYSYNVMLQLVGLGLDGHLKNLEKAKKAGLQPPSEAESLAKFIATVALQTWAKPDDVTVAVQVVRRNMPAAGAGAEEKGFQLPKSKL
jgi:hypothetical protein